MSLQFQDSVVDQVQVLSAAEEEVSRTVASPEKRVKSTRPDAEDRNAEYLRSFKQGLHRLIADSVRLPSTKSRRRFNRHQNAALKMLRSQASSIDLIVHDVLHACVTRDDGVPSEFRASFMDERRKLVPAMPVAEPRPLSAGFWAEFKNFRGDWGKLYQPYLDLEADRLAHGIITALEQAYSAGVIGRMNWIDETTAELSFVDYEFRTAIEERTATDTPLRWNEVTKKYKKPGEHGWWTKEVLRDEHARLRASVIECRHIHTLISVKRYRPTPSFLPERLHELWHYMPEFFRPFCQVITGDVTNDPTPMRFLLNSETFERTERKIEFGQEYFIHDPVLTLGNTFVLAGWTPRESPEGFKAKLGRLFSRPFSSK